MKDSLEREISYLRISLTDRCNLRCVYCVPPDAAPPRRDILSDGEILEIAGAAAELGVRKIRLTGGEPLLRSGVVELCRALAALPGVEELDITTNGVLLPAMAPALKDAGVRRVNISLDTLDAEKYRAVTRGGTLSEAIQGVRAALEAGLGPVKLNTVLMRGFNDEEIPAMVSLTERYSLEVRFIELMPLGEAQGVWRSAYLSCGEVLRRCPALSPAAEDGGVAARYRLPGAPGTVGLIRPMSCGFCERCSRLRLTADGYLKPCLHSREEIPVRGLHGEALRRALLCAAAQKPERHHLSAATPSEAGRNMNAIGG